LVRSKCGSCFHVCMVLLMLSDNWSNAADAALAILGIMLQAQNMTDAFNKAKTAVMCTQKSTKCQYKQLDVDRHSIKCKRAITMHEQSNYRNMEKSKIAKASLQKDKLLKQLQQLDQLRGSCWISSRASPCLYYMYTR